MSIDVKVKSLNPVTDGYEQLETSPSAFGFWASINVSLMDLRDRRPNAFVNGFECKYIGTNAADSALTILNRHLAVRLAASQGEGYRSVISVARRKDFGPINFHPPAVLGIRT
jgi:hypothetical protein